MGCQGPADKVFLELFQHMKLGHNAKKKKMKRKLAKYQTLIQLRM